MAVSNITHNVMYGLQQNFMEGFEVVNKRKKLLNFGGDPDCHTDCPIRNLAITHNIRNG